MVVLVVGASARALADSVRRAGYEPVAADMFGDKDLLRIAPWRSERSGASLVSLAREFGAEGVVFASGIENDPAAVDGLRAAGVRVFAPESDAIRRARDPVGLGRICGRHGIARPGIFPQPSSGGRYLVKSSKSGGGIGVRDWDGDLAGLSSDEYVQEKIEGVSLSAIFAANGGAAALFGVSRQFAGEAFLGASGYAWCGNLMPFDAERVPKGLKESLLAELRRIAAVLVKELGLAGVCGADFILCGETLFLLEINPRVCASFELAELSSNVNVFRLHMEALAGRLPEEPPALMDGPFRGKGIVYAPRDMVAPDTDRWIGTNRRDIPQTGAVLRRGLPICTVVSPPMESGCAVVEYLRREALKVWKECTP